MSAAVGAAARRVFSRTPLIGRYLGIIVLALAIFGLILVAAGKDPFKAYADTFSYTFGNAYGFSELIVRMIPLLLTAVAVAFPARIGMINVGGEGQLYMGAWLATAGALAFSGFPAWALLPLMTALGFVGGAAWAAIPGILRAKKLVNETIATLLLNYVAPMIVGFFIFGPWRAADSSSYPQSPAFADAARLPSFLHTRIHLGLLFALFSLLAYWAIVERTRWGVQMRAIGGNPEAAERLGIPLIGYTVLVMAIGGGIAGLAGMGEVSAIQGRLRQGLSPGYGFTGFLIAWLAGGNPLGILLMTFLFALIISVGDILQITQGLPYAVVNILMAVILFVVLGRRPVRRASR
ncbi:MAG: ABC transporter permease [Spirochaetia bacterium]|jgi:simple sugar transport system permease protein